MKGKQPELSVEQKAWLCSSPVVPAVITVTSSNGSRSFLVKDLDARGRSSGIGQRMGAKGFVLKVEDETTGAIYAAKLCVPEDYDEARTEFVETKLANKLRGSGALFIIPEYVGRVDRFQDMPGSQETLVCFISEWIEGETLEQKCKKADGSITPEFICTISLEVLKAVRFLNKRGLKHDDLHWGNIMLRRIDPALALLEQEKQKLEVSIIDMGSLKPVEQETTKSKDDDLSLLQIMVNLYNLIHKDRSTISTYPHFLRGYKTLIEQMADDDHLRYFATEEALPRELHLLRDALQYQQLPELQRVFHPFEAISAEHLADDATLLELFEHSLPWFSSVLEPKPLVLTGPRGCGKSMLFRYMATKTHLAGNHKILDDLNEFHFFGVYVSCATHLQNNLMWIARKEGRAREMAQSIATYFQLVVLRELLKSLAAAYSDSALRAKYALSESGFDELISHISEYFERSVETPRLTSKLRLLHFSEDIDRLRVKLHLDLLQQRIPETVLPDTFLGDVTQRMRTSLPRFAKVPVVFLLDDYSSNRVHSEIQGILNRIIFERRDSHYFKVSCEKFGFSPHDVDGVRIDPSREYEEIDAGSYATADLPESLSKQFLAGLINRRLSTAGWAGRAETLIGSADEFKNDVALAKYIRTDGGTQGRHFYYFGMEHLARLWSGDIATILQIVKEMFILGAVREESTTTIPKHVQHKAIVSVSRAFKERVNGYHPYGPEMAVILNNFGGMSKSILASGSLDSEDHPRRLYRIEMTKSRPESLLDLLKEKNSGAAKLAKELLRRAVFIQHADSRGKEGPSSQTVRWELRKIFLPAFGLSLERNSYIDVKTLDDFLRLLTNSQGFCDDIRVKYMLGKKQDKRTGNLFGDEDG